MTDTALLWFTVILWFLASNSIFIAAAITFSRWFDVAVPILGCGHPTFTRFDIGETEIRLGAIPINAYATVLDSHNENDFPHVNSEGRRLSDLTLWKQVIFSLIGLIAPLILSLALVRWPRLDGRVIP